ncbi:MAG: OmpA family protein [Pseudomonadota bacterium]
MRAAVSDAMKSFSQDVNRRLDAMTSPRFLLAKTKSVVTRRPIGDFLISDAASALTVRRVLLIDRQSGALLHVWRSQDSGSEKEDDAALVSGMFAALSSFASEKYGSEKEELRSLDLNGITVALRHSPRLTLVVEHEGTLHPEATSRIDALFDELVTLVDQPERLVDVDFAGIAPETAASTNKLKPVLLITAAVLLGLFGWGAFERWTFASHVAKLEQAVTQQIGLNSLTVEADRQNGQIAVGGAVPAGFDVTELQAALAGSEIELIDRTFGLSDGAAIRSEAEELSLRIGETQNMLTGELAKLEALLGQADEASVSARTALANQLTELADRTASLEGVQLAQLELENKRLETRLAELEADMATGVSRLENALAVSRQNFLEELDKLGLTAEQGLAAQSSQTASQAARLSRETEAVRTGLARELARLEATITNQSDTSNSQLLRLERVIAGLANADSQTENRLRDIYRNAERLIESRAVQFANGVEPVAAVQAERTLGEVALLAQTFGLSLEVIGHSDETGADETNEALSQRRAEWGAEGLIALGLDPGAIEVVAMGSQPDHAGQLERQIRFRVASAPEGTL